MPPEPSDKPATETENANPYREANPLLEMLAEQAGMEYDEFARQFSERKNREYAEAFARTPYGKRLLLLPQCLRSSEHCQAVEKGVLYECHRCGACKIAGITDEAERLGYIGAFILKGGRAVARLIEELEPEAVLGVACDYEGMIGIMECERRGIPVQFVPLTRDGCVDTDVDKDRLSEMLRRRSED